jgi:formylglycine-generating enzyme required for sulfatase activity
MPIEPPAPAQTEILLEKPAPPVVKPTPIVPEAPKSAPIGNTEPVKPGKPDPLRTDPFIPADFAAYAPPPPKNEPAKPAPIKPAPVIPTADAPKQELREKNEPPRPAPRPAPKSESKPESKPEPKKESAPTPVSKSSSSKSRIPLLIGLGAVGALLIAIIGYVLLGKRNDAEGTTAAVVSPTVATQISPSPAPTSAFPEAAAPEGMVYVLGGALRIGRDDGEENERPAHTVTIKPFFIDRVEVTNELYQKFIEATGHPAPPLWNGPGFPKEKEKLPVTDVSWEDATAYAKWALKRLPTEEEWEFAARGDQGRLYPWGDIWKPNTANVTTEGEKPELAPVGQFVGGASPFGVLDLSGNAWEWTSNEYKEYPGGTIDAAPAGFTNRRVIRGGSYETAGQKATTTLRRGWPGSRNDWPNGRTPDYAQTGFRCAQDIPPQ